jgi:tetratricopeptide (TPR) repeat protein
MLTSALDAHKSGNHQLATQKYHEVLSKGPNKVAYINLAAIYREHGNAPRAKGILVDGITKLPSAHILWFFLAKCELDLGDFPAALRSILVLLEKSPHNLEYRLLLPKILSKLGCSHLAFQSLRATIRTSSLICNFQDYLNVLFCTLEVAIEHQCVLADLSDNPIEKILGKLCQLSQDNDTDLYYRLKSCLVLVQYYTGTGDLGNAFDMRELARILLRSSSHLLDSVKTKEILAVYHNFSWNLSISLIKSGDFLKGWKLYEHGLCVSAPPPQRWQRALKKPFSYDEVPIWDGSSLFDRSLLILGEQAIGDTMMFLSLLPLLESKTSSITLLVQPRLVPIYRRTLPNATIISSDPTDYSKALPSMVFDYQIPSGSLPCRLLNNCHDRGYMPLKLVSDPIQRDRLRSTHSEGRLPLIGISWQGGVTPKRIPYKSTTLETLLPLLSEQSYSFISLQYGKANNDIPDFNSKYGTSLKHDPSIDPMVDMDSWLSLVDACDLVVSIANTTIHGSGGLGKPTIALLGPNPDWRWLNPDVSSNCFWYPSVSPVHFDSAKGWPHSVNRAISLIEELLLT